MTQAGYKAAAFCSNTTYMAQMLTLTGNLFATGSHHWSSPGGAGNPPGADAGPYAVTSGAAAGQHSAAASWRAWLQLSAARHFCHFCSSSTPCWRIHFTGGHLPVHMHCIAQIFCMLDTHLSGKSGAHTQHCRSGM